MSCYSNSKRLLWSSLKKKVLSNVSDVAHGVGVKMSFQGACTVFLKTKIWTYVILYTDMFECLRTSTKHVIKCRNFFLYFINRC